MKAVVTYADMVESYGWNREFDQLESVLPPTDVTACWIIRATKKVWFLSPSVVAHIEVTED